jgi:hypothetical protein
MGAGEPANDQPGFVMIANLIRNFAEIAITKL